VEAHVRGLQGLGQDTFAAISLRERRSSLLSPWLDGANLTDAKGVTNEELAQQAWSLKGATTPDGQKYEEWLKDREKRQQAE
jgi:hypothetical protein